MRDINTFKSVNNTHKLVNALILSLAPVLTPGAQPLFLRWLEQRQAGIAEDQQSWWAFFLRAIADVQQAGVRAGNAAQIFNAAICYFTADKIRETVHNLGESQCEYIKCIIEGSTTLAVLQIMAALSGASFQQEKAYENKRLQQAINSLKSSENPLQWRGVVSHIMTSLPALCRNQRGYVMRALCRLSSVGAAFSTTTQPVRDPQLVALNQESLAEAMRLVSTPIERAAESALGSHLHDALQQCVQWFRNRREENAKSQYAYAALQILFTENTVARWSEIIAGLIPDLMASPGFLSLFEQQADIDSLIRYMADSGAATADDQENVVHLLQQFETVLMSFLSNRADSISDDLLDALDLPAVEGELTDLAQAFFSAFYPKQLYANAVQPVIKRMLARFESPSVRHFMKLSLIKQLQDPNSVFAENVVHNAFRRIGAKVGTQYQSSRDDSAERQKRIFLYELAQIDPNAAVLPNAVYNNLLEKYTSWHISMAQQGSNQNNPEIMTLFLERNIAGLQDLFSNELPNPIGSTASILKESANLASIDDVCSFADTAGEILDTILKPDWHDRIMRYLEQYKSDTTQPYAARFAMRVVKYYLTPQASDHLYDLLFNHVLHGFLSSHEFLTVLKRTELSQAALSNQLNPNDNTSPLEKQRAAHCYTMLHAAFTHWLQNNGEQLAVTVADKTSLKRFKGYLQEMVRAELQDADSHLQQFMRQALVDHVGSISPEYHTFMQRKFGFEKSLRHKLSSKDKNAEQLMQNFDLLHDAAKKLQGIADEQMKRDLKLNEIIDQSDVIKRKIEDGHFKKLLEIQALLVTGRKYVQRSVKKVVKKDDRMRRHSITLQDVKDLRSNSEGNHQLAWYYKIMIIVLSFTLPESVLNRMESYITSEQDQLKSKRKSLEQLDTLTADLGKAIDKAIEDYQHNNGDDDIAPLIVLFDNFKRENSAMAAKAPLVGLFKKVGGLRADKNTDPSPHSATIAQAG